MKLPHAWKTGEQLEMEHARRPCRRSLIRRNLAPASVAFAGFLLAGAAGVAAGWAGAAIVAIALSVAVVALKKSP